MRTTDASTTDAGFASQNSERERERDRQTELSQIDHGADVLSLRQCKNKPGGRVCFDTA